MATITLNFLSKAHTDLLNSIKGYTDTEEWLVTNKRFVAFFDILGFKDLVLRNTHETIFEKLNEISNLKDGLNPNIIDKEFSNDGIKPLEVVTFSDSIVIFSKNNTVESFKIFIQSVNWFFSQIIEKEIPIKGAIAYGDISIDSVKQIFFGQPLIDAFLLQEDVDYFGVVAHNSIDAFIQEYNLFQDIEEYVFEIQTPLKSGKITHLNLRYFPFLIYDEVDKMNLYLEKFKVSMSGRPRKYLENTISLYGQYVQRLNISVSGT
ncbi:hypothetical protein [Chryseobacterium cheonjiense]|uniref:Guanylate cyclase domain-containing protein n=1 Tax=Chryseobacterium cheonjiense TaxID=2728845 RepID=A0A7Y0A6Z6_9FLAO|nr:hypothetical protein [Chryseobacterium cheonjiense]NML57814.1 hypothetical protein [Chryseobacterium cheonjiense]